MRLHVGVLAMALTACIGVAGCSNVDISSNSFTRWQILSVPAAGIEHLQITGENGDIRLTAADIGATRVRARIQTNVVSQLQSDRMDAARNGDTETLSTSCPKAHIAIWAIQNCGIDYYVTYPRGLKLAVNAINGDVTIIGPAGATAAQTTNGDVTIDDARSDISAHSHQGDVRVTLAPDWSGSSIATTTTFGDVRLGVPSGFRGSVQTHTVAGDVTGASEVAPGGATTVDLATTFGDVTISAR